MTYYQRIDSDLAQIIAAKGDSVTFNGAVIACAINRPSIGSTPMEGGLWSEETTSIVTRRSLLATLPVQGDRITVDGASVFVARVKSASSHPAVTIEVSNTAPPK